MQDNIPYRSFGEIRIRHTCAASSRTVLCCSEDHAQAASLVPPRPRNPPTTPQPRLPLRSWTGRPSKRSSPFAAARLSGSSSAAGGYQAGRTFLVERPALIEFLEGLEDSGAAPEARARKQRVAAVLNEVANFAAAQRVQIRTAPDVLRRQPVGLPASIERVAPGKLQISYRGAEDLLAKIVELAASAANDFPAFRSLYEESE